MIFIDKYLTKFRFNYKTMLQFVTATIKILCHMNTRTFTYACYSDIHVVYGVFPHNLQTKCLGTKLSISQNVFSIYPSIIRSDVYIYIRISHIS